MGERAFPIRELNGECYIHRMNCEVAVYADHILKEKGVTCSALLRPALRFGVGAHSGQRAVAHRADAPAQRQICSDRSA